MTRYLTIFFIFFIALYFSSLAKAQEDCNDRSRMIDMYICFGEKLQASDARIAKLYNQMITSMPDEYRESLEKSQSTWQAYRDAQCAFVFAADDSRREIPCRNQMNEEREKFLIHEMEEDCNGCIPYKEL